MKKTHLSIQFKIIISLVLTLPLLGQARAQEYDISGIGFYNVENLFDTVDTKNVNDIDFTVEGKNQWGDDRYQYKLNNISYVISQVAQDVTPDGLAVVGVSEIENKTVLEDLVKQESIAGRKYQIIHYDSPDRRGIDVALLYQEKYFKPLFSKGFPLTMSSDTSFRTRSQLLVSGELLGERMHFIVSHWPSRSGGEKRSRPKRIAAGDLGRSIIDSILIQEPSAKIIYMGDLNDDPIDKSVTKHLGSIGQKEFLTNKKLFNPMVDLYRQGVGSLAWRDTWNLFDQLLVSSSLMNQEKGGWSFYQAKVFNKSFLMQKDGSFKGYPFRTFAGGNYKGGYSDHFPVYLYLFKEQ